MGSRTTIAAAASMIVHAAFVIAIVAIWPARQRISNPAYLMIGYLGGGRKDARVSATDSDGKPANSPIHADRPAPVRAILAPRERPEKRSIRLSLNVASPKLGRALSRTELPSASSDNSPAPSNGKGNGSYGESYGEGSGAGSGGVADGGTSVPAAYGDNPPPPYPEEARFRNQQGTVWLKVLVAINGFARRIELMRSSGSALLDDAAIETVREKWRFAAARRDGAAVESWVVVPIRFDLRQARGAGDP